MYICGQNLKINNIQLFYTMKKVLLAIAIVGLCFSCSKKEEETPVAYDNIDSGKVANVPNKVTTNINVNGGKANFGQSTQLQGDLNLNRGKVVINADTDTSKVIVSGNANLNDTVVVKRGILMITHDFNINNKGVVNCYNGASVVVGNHLNQNGTVYGFKNFKAAVNNLSGAIKIEQEPQNWE